MWGQSVVRAIYDDEANDLSDADTGPAVGVSIVVQGE